MTWKIEFQHLQRPPLEIEVSSQKELADKIAVILSYHRPTINMKVTVIGV